VCAAGSSDKSGFAKIGDPSADGVPFLEALEKFSDGDVIVPAGSQNPSCGIKIVKPTGTTVTGRRRLQSSGVQISAAWGVVGLHFWSNFTDLPTSLPTAKPSLSPTKRPTNYCRFGGRCPDGKIGEQRLATQEECSQACTLLRNKELSDPPCSFYSFNPSSEHATPWCFLYSGACDGTLTGSEDWETCGVHPPITAAPTRPPTARPSSDPTATPTSQPSFVPSPAPSGTPTTDPTAIPTLEPSPLPTGEPSRTPTGLPTLAASGTVCDAANPCSNPTTGSVAVPGGTVTVAPINCFEDGCKGVTFSGLVSVTCRVNSCSEAKFFGLATVSCDTGNSCQGLAAYDRTVVICDAEGACEGATLNGRAEAQCSVEGACEGVVLNDAASCTGVGCPEQAAESENGMNMLPILAGGSVVVLCLMVCMAANRGRKAADRGHHRGAGSWSSFGSVKNFLGFPRGDAFGGENDREIAFYEKEAKRRGRRGRKRGRKPRAHTMPDLSDPNAEHISPRDLPVDSNTRFNI